MWLNRKRLIMLIISIIVVSISYMLYIFIPTTIGKVVSKYINIEEIIKITYIIDEVRKDDMLHHISDEESISFLYDYFYGIEVTHAATVPYFEETVNFIFNIYDKSGNVVTITSHDSYNGLYLYIQSDKWYKVKNYNNSTDIITDIVVTSFLKSMYEVNDYENYERSVDIRNGIIKEKMANSDLSGITQFSDEEAKEIYGQYIDKYAPFVTKDGLDKLLSLGLITYMDKLAYENNIYVRAENIELNETEEHEYMYTIKLKFIKDDAETSGECTGIVGLAQDEDGSYKVNFIKKTDSGVINEMLEKINN